MPPTPAAPPAPDDLLGYQRRGGTPALYDELLADNGAVRPHWKEILSYFAKLGPAEISRRWSQARRILRDSGVAYNAGGAGPLRSWELNPIPLRIPAGEWETISAAVRQRGRLLNALLNDLYGPQTLLREGLIPPALILGNGAYLRPCVGVPVPHDARLLVYAVDLARGVDGGWWVLSDRTQAPSGVGYALENRIVSSRIFPEIFRTARIARLSGFFRKMKESLEALSPRPGVPATVALLTAGPKNETYFEQAYLARQLNIPLVEGQDLAVRGGAVFIKTLQGLQRVDVLLRRVDDDYCDPLEFRDESLLGIPGLMNAVRAGTVTLANALGSGLVQCPALGAFLPKLCERLFGEKLLMPSVATWWCGQPAEQRYVLDNLHGLALDPAFSFPGEIPTRKATRDYLKGVITRHPELWVAQEFVRLSQCPDFNGNGNGTAAAQSQGGQSQSQSQNQTPGPGHLEPRPVILRVFAVRVGDDYVVMPGGLTRIAEETSSTGVLVQRGGGGKDTWVDQAEPEAAAPIQAPAPAPGGKEVVPAPPPAAPVEEPDPQRASSGLTSRVADNLFWLGRYAERAEFTARMARTALKGLFGPQGELEIADALPILRTFLAFGQLPELPAEADAPQLGAWLAAEMVDPAQPGSLVDILQGLRDTATAVRDQITADAWRIVNQLPDLLPAKDDGEMEFHLSQVILHHSALNGVLAENMVQGHGWRFLDLGRRIERVIYGASLIAESCAPRRTQGAALFDILLDVFDAGVAYRQKYTGVRRLPVLELLLCDESAPRSLASQLARILDNLTALPRDADAALKLPEERLVFRHLTEVLLLDVNALDPALFATLEEAMLELSTGITQRFFTHLHASSVSLASRVAADLPETV